MKLQEQEKKTGNFEYKARNDDKVFSATQELELVKYFKHSLKITFQSL
jgi:hypothetical protein